MELNLKEKKKLNVLDKIVLKTCNLLEKFQIKYVIVSSYVAILFGRSDKKVVEEWLG